jgi:hypothetical protein
MRTVGKLAGELAPRRIENAAVQGRLRAHVLARHVHRPVRRGREVLDLKILDRDDGLLAAEIRGELVQPVGTLSRDAPMQASQPSHRFASVR